MGQDMSTGVDLKLYMKNYLKNHYLVYGDYSVDCHPYHDQVSIVVQVTGKEAEILLDDLDIELAKFGYNSGQFREMLINYFHTVKGVKPHRFVFERKV